MPIQIKRVYDPADKSDGKRFLVDRLWPRGVSKEKAQLDGWLKDIAPSVGLRKWFSHQPDLFAAFKKRYLEELAADPQKQPAIQEVLDMAGQGMVSLLYAVKSPTINHAAVLLEFLRQKGG